MGSLKCFGLVTMQYLIVALGLVATAAAQYLPYPYAAGYPLLPYAVPVAPFVAHPNGALVPLEPKDVVDARAEHLQAVADALNPAERKRRSADAEADAFYAAYPYAAPVTYAYAGVPFGSSTGLDPITQGLDAATQGYAPYFGYTAGYYAGKQIGELSVIS